MLPSVSVWAVRFRSSLRLREAVPFPPHPVSTVSVRAAELKLLPAAPTRRYLALRPRDLPRHVTKRCFARLRNFWLRHSSELIPVEGQRARALAVGRF